MANGLLPISDLIAPRMNRPVGNYSFQDETLIPYLQKVASGQIAEQGLKRYGDAVRAGLLGDYSQFGEIAGDAIGGGFKLAGGLLGTTKGTNIAQSLLDVLNQKVPQADAYLTQLDNGMRINKLVVPKEIRNQGIGTQFMNEVTDFADKNNLNLFLDASGDFGGTKAGQRRFYGRHGFVENKGRNRDLSIMDTMYRNPKQQDNLLGVDPKDYGIEHRPMTVESGAATLDDLLPAFGEDIYNTKNALQYFGSGYPGEAKILKIMQSVRGKPNAKVTIYRGVPKGEGGKINSGDWVTLLPEMAKEYGEQVIKMEVPASHITSWADSLMEFGYYPKN